MNVDEKLARIAMSKSICKEYSNSKKERVVYLQNNDEFQIQLFNPYSYNICCSITIDDKYIGNDIVVRPGERIWLERYLNTPNKFKFSTYTVEGGNNKIVMEAIKNNGVVNIKFYKEKQKVEPVRIEPLVNWVYQPYNYCNDMVYSTCTADSACEATHYNTSCEAKSFGFAPSSVTRSMDNAQYTCDCLTASVNNAINCDYSLKLETSASLYKNTGESNNNIKSVLNKKSKKQENIETGRIEKGSYSDQKFVNVDYDFETWPFKTENIHILPLSQKVVNKGDLEKVYCPNCGRKLKSKYKFCPYCGKEID